MKLYGVTIQMKPLLNADTHLISFMDSSAGPNDVKHQIIHASAIWIPL